MNIFIQHDAATLATLAGVPRPDCDALIVRQGKLDDVLAAAVGGNPLDPAANWLLDVDLPSQRIVSWSGSLSEEGLFASHPPNWLRAGREAFNAFCREIAPQLTRHKRTLCFQPHSRHVLSDAPSCLNLLREHDGGPFEIALSPATMLEPAMVNDIEDHLRRMFEGLGSRCAILMLEDVAVHEADGESWCEAVPLGDGVLPGPLVRSLIESTVPAEVPVVITAAKMAQQLEWLRG